MSNEDAVLQLVNALPELERAAQWLELQIETFGVPPIVVGKLQVALDEVVSNIINHGLQEAPEGSRTIELRLRRRPGEVELEIVDDGPSFDPTSQTPTHRHDEHGVRQIGGAGLPFVRGLMDEIRYLRQDGANYLTICAHWPAKTE